MRGRDDLLFSVRLSIRYHDRRRRFYESMSSFSSFAATVFGSAAAAAFLGNWGKPWVAAVALAVAALSALTLVVGPVAKAWRHADLRRRFTELERLIVTSDPTTELVADCRAERLSIEADEPPVLRVLATICHNEQSRSMGYGPDEMIPVGFWQRRFASFFDLAQHKLHEQQA